MNFSPKIKQIPLAIFFLYRYIHPPTHSKDIGKRGGKLVGYARNKNKTSRKEN